jgi:hypothetical protein
MAGRKWMYRQDVARLLEVTVRQVASNEARWGLVPTRINQRVVRYEAKATMAALEERGFIRNGAAASAKTGAA